MADSFQVAISNTAPLPLRYVHITCTNCCPHVLILPYSFDIYRNANFGIVSRPTWSAISVRIGSDELTSGKKATVQNPYVSINELKN
jgi:hypothetical protein